MRILVTVASLEREFGGPTAKARNLADELRRLGDDAIVVGVGSSSSPRTLGLPRLGGFHGTPMPRGVRSLRELATGADIIHVIGYRDPVGTVAAGAARRSGIPYMLEPAGMHRRRLRSERLKWVFDRALGQTSVQGAASVVATSAVEQRELVDDGVPAGLIVRRPNGVDVDSLLPLPERGSFRSRAGIPHDVPLALSLSRITRKKGLDDLVRAIVELEGTHVAIVGPVEPDGTLELVHAVAGASSDRVHVMPRGVWGDDRAPLFADADVFCLPSATENFGTTAAEAAALGLPVVVSDVCGVAEWLPSASSRVVPFGDVAAIADAVAQLSTPGTKTQAEEAAPSVRDALSWQAVASTQRALYEAVARGGTASG